MKTLTIKINKGNMICGSMALICIVLATIFFSFLFSLQDLNAKTEALRDLQHRMKIFAGRFNDVRSAIHLIRPEDSSMVLDDIINVGGALGVDFQSIEAQKIAYKKKTPYQSLPIAIRTRSGFQDLGEFFTGLHGLDSAVVIIKEFVVSKSAITPEVAANIDVEVLLTNE